MHTVGVVDLGPATGVGSGPTQNFTMNGRTLYYEVWNIYFLFLDLRGCF